MNHPLLWGTRRWRNYLQNFLDAIEIFIVTPMLKEVIFLGVQEAVAVTTAIQEEIFLEMGIGRLNLCTASEVMLYMI